MAFVLFFTEQAVATEAEVQEAAKYAGKVVLRNASAAREGDPIEKNDGVAGAVPAVYAKCALAKLKAEAEQPTEQATEQATEQPAPTALFGPK